MRYIIILLSVSLLFSQSLYSQCKLERINDDFSSSKTVSSTDVKLASVFPLIGDKKPWDLVMSFSLVDSNYCTIMVTHQSQSYSAALSSISFRFQDGTIINKESPSGSGDFNTGLGYSYTYTVFSLSMEELMLFASKDLLKFQAIFTYFPDYPIVEEDIKKKSVEIIRKDASCILSEMKPTSNAPLSPADECKYEKNIVDDFTKSRIAITKPAIIYEIKIPDFGTMFMDVCGSSINGAYGLQFNLGATHNGAHEINEDKMPDIMQFDQLYLLLANDEVIILKEKDPSQFIKNGSTYFSYKLFSVNNDSIWAKLNTTPLKKIRQSMNDVEKETQEINIKYFNSIMKVISCIDILGIPKSKTSIDPKKSE